MKIVCLHGYFCFYPKTESEVSRFVNYYKQPLVQFRDFFTFPLLANAPRYSLVVTPWLGLPATVTYAGREPWDVMKANGFVYNVVLRTVVPKLSIVSLGTLTRSTHYYINANAILQPGTLHLGQQVLTYDSDLDIETKRLKIRSFGYE